MNIPSLSLIPRYDAPSAWWQHVPVAHWLVDVIKPAAIVELGAHYGVSFFAFCEAAEAFSSNSFVFAVDTWDGDVHAGSYSENVYETVLAHWASFHRKRSSLVRSTFDEAASYFEDETIDLLHIDGLHTYEAVAHDFETWLPKLKGDFVVLFHDINVRERGFGVWKLWLELKEDPQYLSFEVLNGYGLGVLVRGSRHKNLLNDFASVLPMLAAKGELVEKLSELRLLVKGAQGDAEQAKNNAMQARGEAELAFSQLCLNKGELEYSLLETRRYAEKLAWCRSQHQHLMHIIKLQTRCIGAFMEINGRALSR